MLCLLSFSKFLFTFSIFIFQDSSQLSNKIAIVPASPIPSMYYSTNDHSPLTLIRSTPDVDIEVFTPENNSWVPFPILAKSSKKFSRNAKNLFGNQNSFSPITPW